ncbi:uncharacterized protein F4822DRAFT_191686 [Hypoxylon trugodes]|uniref:uncharacterized protein n=1 Tax=Hypoxylon trugodes TaxID=326681 RepID=UPI0021970280|nr:uncharacterized protein F4822DRAFT_191686 [Hypoxylon trugodes]KAI1391623.1 hypothetical protein F4822DRAFT_191686 [Hypoxylon trugodes]
MLFNAISLLALGTAVVAMPAGEVVCPHTRCFDAVNACGVKWGGCYDMCTQERPPPPPCASITGTTSVPTITDLPPLPTTITSLPTTSIVLPTSITSLPGSAPTTITSASACTSTGTICVDHLKTCGSPPTAILTYGGCYGACESEPTFSQPPCPVPTVSQA